MLSLGCKVLTEYYIAIQLLHYFLYFSISLILQVRWNNVLALYSSMIFALHHYITFHCTYYIALTLHLNIYIDFIYFLSIPAGVCTCRRLLLQLLFGASVRNRLLCSNVRKQVTISTKGSHSRLFLLITPIRSVLMVQGRTDQTLALCFCTYGCTWTHTVLPFNACPPSPSCMWGWCFDWKWWIDKLQSL